MNKLVKKYRFLVVWRIGENESWFTDMAAEGFHLLSLGPMFATFERGNPEAMRYRVDISYKAKTISPEQRELYAESGWEHVCGHGGMFVFRSPESLNAPELHTDPAEQAYTLEKLNFVLTVNGIIVTLLYIMTFFMLYAALAVNKTPLLSFVEGSYTNMPIMVLLYIYTIFESNRSAFSLRKFVRSLQEGRTVNHHADWKRLRRITMTALTILAISSPFIIGLPFVQMASWHTETLAFTKDNQLHIRLADIENDPLLEREEDYINGTDFLNDVRYKWSPYASTILSLHEHGMIPGRMWYDESGVYSPSLNYNLYRLKFSWLADRIVTELCRKYESYRDTPILEETGYSGFNRLFVRSEGTRQEIIASKDNVVIYVCYFGESSIDAVMSAAAECLLVNAVDK